SSAMVPPRRTLLAAGHAPTGATTRRRGTHRNRVGIAPTDPRTGLIARSYGGGASGRPNSGNRRAASRKDVHPTIRPSATSNTTSAHGIRAPPGPGGGDWANSGE